MSTGAGSHIPDRVVDWLLGGNPIVVATVGGDGRPYSCIVGSGVAIDTSTVRFALFSNSRTLANIRANSAVFIETLGDGLVFGMSGTARVIKNPMEASAYPPHHYTMVEVVVDGVKDDHPPGVRITGMKYDFSPSRRPAERLRRRQQLCAELLAGGDEEHQKEATGIESQPLQEEGNLP